MNARTLIAVTVPRKRRVMGASLNGSSRLRKHRKKCVKEQFVLLLRFGD